MMEALDYIVIAMGAYVVWASLRLWRNGAVSGQVMKSPDRDVKNIRDLDGFRKFVFPRCLVMGILIVLLGLFSLARDNLQWFAVHSFAAAVLETAAVCGVIVYMFWYAHEIHVAEKKFYQ